MKCDTLPGTEHAFSKLHRLCLDSDDVVLTASDIDGDSLGAIFSLRELLIREGCTHSVKVVFEENIPQRYQFLVPRDIQIEVAHGRRDWSRSFVIVLDSSPDRFKILGPSFKSAKFCGIVDHHHTADTQGYDFVCYDAKSPSTTVLIYRFYQLRGVTPSKNAASNLFAGLVFDTSIFRYKLTSPEALEMAADLMRLGVQHAQLVEELLLVQPFSRVKFRSDMIARADFGFNRRFCYAVMDRPADAAVDSGGLVDDLIFIEGVRVAGVLVLLDSGRTRISLRSRSDINVGLVAQQLHETGGGHARSAGVTLTLTPDIALKELSKALAIHFGG